MNPLIPVDIFLPPDDFRSTQLLIARDFQAINAGIFLLRVSKWSYKFMCDINAFRSYNPGFYLNWLEQSAMIALIEQYPNYHDDGLVRYIPQNWFNAYLGPRDDKTGVLNVTDVGWYNHTRHGGPGVMMLHFAGFDDKPKMAMYLDIAKQHNETWEIPLEQSEYPSMVEEFWLKEREELGSGTS